MTQPDTLAAVAKELRTFGFDLTADRIERLDAEMREKLAAHELAGNGFARALQKRIDGDNELIAELAACKSILADPRVRALFPPLPDGTVLVSCSGSVHETR